MQAATFSSSFFYIVARVRGHHSTSSATTSPSLLHHINPLHVLHHYLLYNFLWGLSPPYRQLRISHPLSSVCTIPPLHMSKPSPLALLTLSPKCLAGTVPLTYCDTKSVPPGHSQTSSSSSTSSLWVRPTISKPYIIEGFTTVLQIFLFSAAAILLSLCLKNEDKVYVQKTRVLSGAKGPTLQQKQTWKLLQQRHFCVANV